MGASKPTGGYPNIWGYPNMEHPNIQRVSKHMGASNIQGPSKDMGHPSKQGPSKHMGVSIYIFKIRSSSDFK